MPAARRYIQSGKVYEVVLRARTGLPFPAWDLIQLLLASAMARAQRDSKVILGHFLWMANHVHLLIVAKDADECKKFYMEVAKKTTDYMKKLLGVKQLSLWEPGRPVVLKVLHINALIEKIAYIYANPANANLVDHISEYPGFSSWSLFNQSPQADSAGQEVPWIRQPSISALPSRKITRRQDYFFTQTLKDKNQRYKHQLAINPRALYAAFGVTEENDIQNLNQAVLAEIEKRHQEIRNARELDGKKLRNPSWLRDEAIIKQPTPKKRDSDRKALFFTTDKELALEFLREFRAFCQACRQAFLAWKAGDTTAQWPPGAFRPSMGPLANAI